MSDCPYESLLLDRRLVSAAVLSGLHLGSPAFDDGKPIPVVYTQVGDNVSPPLSWEGAPSKTKSFALVVEDPDAVKGTFTHWLLYNLPANCTRLETAIARDLPLDGGACQGQNSRGSLGYLGPNPPSGMHRYFFYLYAVDRMLPLKEGVDRSTLDQALQGHVLAEGRIMGTFTKSC